MAFSQTPYNELNKIGFDKALLYEHSKWYFTEETLQGSINEFVLTCEVTRENPKIIEFTTEIEPRELIKSELKRLKKKFKTDSIEFDFDALTKKYKIREPSISTIQDLEKSLVQFTQILLEENFKPVK